MKVSVRLLGFVVFFVLSCVTSMSQTKTEGTVMSVEDGVVYIDLGTSKVTPGTILSVLDSRGDKIGQIVVYSTLDSYSMARAVKGTSVARIAGGMIVTDQSVVSKGVQSATKMPYISQVQQPERLAQDNRVSVIVPPAQVNDVVGVGHFGGYVADLLMEQLMMCSNVRLIDRSLFSAQIDEAELAGSYIDQATAIEKGKIAGARYAVQVTMQKPDVANVRTGIPLASIMGALQGGLNRNIGAQYMSNMEIAKLKASVSLSARVIDIQTGEVLFMTSGTGKAEGESQLGMEYGALGGAKLNEGADGFKQTVTGKAIQKAFMTVGRDLDTYFNGKATKKVMGSASGFGRFDDKIERKGMSLYSGINKLSNDDLQSLFYENNDLYFKYKSAKKQLRWSNAVIVIGSLATICSCIYVINSDGDVSWRNQWLCGTIAGCGIIITGIALNVSAHKKVEDIKNKYNNKLYSNSRSMDCHLDLVAANGGGIGLRLSF